MIRRELGIFLIVGSLTVLVDFAIYRTLLWSAALNINVNIDIAKATGFIAGTLLAYFANRFWTFGHKSPAAGSAWRFVVLYASTLAANVVINSLALNLFSDSTAAIQLAFLVATGVSASLNFVGMKVFVFRTNSTAELQ